MARFETHSSQGYECRKSQTALNAGYQRTHQTRQWLQQVQPPSLVPIGKSERRELTSQLPRALERRIPQPVASALASVTEREWLRPLKKMLEGIGFADGHIHERDGVRGTE